LKSGDEVRSEVWSGGTECGGEVGAVRGEGDGVLVVVGGEAVPGEGGGEPVGGANDGGFGVHVLFWGQGRVVWKGAGGVT
jgi:hypothetical protein